MLRPPERLDRLKPFVRVVADKTFNCPYNASGDWLLNIGNTREIQEPQTKMAPNTIAIPAQQSQIRRPLCGRPVAGVAARFLSPFVRTSGTLVDRSRPVTFSGFSNSAPQKAQYTATSKLCRPQPLQDIPITPFRKDRPAWRLHHSPSLSITDRNPARRNLLVYHSQIRESTRAKCGGLSQLPPLVTL